MATRVVTGTVLMADLVAYPNSPITFELENDFTDLGVTYLSSVIEVMPNATTGYFTVTLAVPTTPATAIYRIRLLDSTEQWIYLTSGPATDLATLLTLAGSPIAQSALQTVIDAHKIDPTYHEYNVMSYGAAGNGIHDDTVAIQAAIAAAIVAGSGEVYLPPGTYLINDTLIPLNNSKIYGGGINQTIIYLADNSNVKLLGGNNLTDVHISNLTLNGNKANNAAATDNFGIGMWSPVRVTIENVRVLNTKREAITLYGTPVDCRIVGCSASGIEGYGCFAAACGTSIEYCIARDSTSVPYITVGADSKVIGNKLYQNAGNMGAIFASGANTSILDNLCDFTGTDGTLIATSNVNYVNISHNRLLGGACGIHLGGLSAPPHTNSYCTISNNIITDCISMDGILLGGNDTDTGYSNSVVGNTIKGTKLIPLDPSSEGVGIESHLRRTTIAGNVIEDCDGIGIWIGNSDDDGSTIIGNAIYNCGMNYRAGEWVQGIKIVGSNITCSGNTVLNIGDADVLGGIGITVACGPTYDVTDIVVTGNRCGDTRTPQYQIYGIQVTNAGYGAQTPYYVHIANNDVRDNITAGVYLQNGTTHTVRDNPGYVTHNYGAEPTVDDGDTIDHGLAGTPLWANVNASVAGEIATVTTLDAAHITVAIKKNDGSAGTQQTIYWEAEV